MPFAAPMRDLVYGAQGMVAVAVVAFAAHGLVLFAPGVNRPRPRASPGP